jgi:hypothetical protein
VTVSDVARISAELTGLEHILDELAGIASRTDDSRRHELIQLRKRLAAQIAEIGRLADPLFSAGDPETARVYRAKFSAMRSATAMHQANWPAVRLDDGEAGYRVSSNAVSETNRGFITWMRATLPSYRA